MCAVLLPLSPPVRGTRPGAIPALGHGWQRRVGARGGRGGGVRSLPGEGPAAPRYFSSSAPRSRRVLVLLRLGSGTALTAAEAPGLAPSPLVQGDF